MEFKGRISWFWYVLPLVLFAVCLAITLDAGSVSRALPLLLAVVLLVSFLVRNKTVITANHTLVIKLGLFTKTISLADVKSIETTRSIWSSWSTSTQRLLISYGTYDEVMISVQQEELFFNFLQLRYPSISIKKDRN